MTTMQVTIAKPPKPNRSKGSWAVIPCFLDSQTDAIDVACPNWPRLPGTLVPGLKLSAFLTESMFNGQRQYKAVSAQLEDQELYATIEAMRSCKPNLERKVLNVVKRGDGAKLVAARGDAKQLLLL